MSATPDNMLKHTGPVVPPSGPRLRLKTTTLAQTAACETTQPVTLIGSRRDCDLALNDPEVSKIHCAIVHTGGAFLVCDLCSRSGTFVNGQPVRVGPLNPGDMLRVGTLDLMLELATPPQSFAPAGLNLAQSATPARRPCLAVGGQSIDLAAGAALIGRRSTCDIVVDTPDASLAHALLFTFDDRPAICDLGSRSGTILNNDRIHLAWVRDTDHLSIGGESFTIACASAPPPATEDAVVVAQPPAADGARNRPATGAGPVPDVVLATLAEQRRAIEMHTRALARREAELDTLAMLLALRLDHTNQLKAQLSQRAAEIERTGAEARARLAQAVKHEQALTSAWQELERWHSTLEARYKMLRGQATSDLPTPPPDAGLKHIRNAAPVAQLFTPPDGLGPSKPGSGMPNA